MKKRYFVLLVALSLKKRERRLAINTLISRFACFITILFLFSCASSHDFCQNEKVDLTVNNAKCFNGYQIIDYLARYNHEFDFIELKKADNKFDFTIMNTMPNSKFNRYAFLLDNINIDITYSEIDDGDKLHNRMLYTNKSGNLSIDVNLDGISDIIKYKDGQRFRLYNRQLYLTNKEHCSFINKKWVKLDFDYDLGEFVINKSYVCKKTKLN